jgi:hypothetical protein
VISKRGQELNGTDEKQSPHQDVEKIKLNGAHYSAEGSLVVSYGVVCIRRRNY